MDIYYNYFYLLMMTKYPDMVISRMNQISYDHDRILNCVMRLESLADKKDYLWGWNLYETYKRMLKGLYLEAIHRIPNIKSELSEEKEEPEKTKLDLIKNLLKGDKEKNEKLLKVINRVEAHLENVKNVQRHVRERRYADRFKKEQEERVAIPEEKEEYGQEQEEINVTIKFAELRQRKMDYTNRSIANNIMNVTERDIIDQVYDDMNQSRFGGNNANQDRNNHRGFSLVNNLFLNSKKNN